MTSRTSDFDLALEALTPLCGREPQRVPSGSPMFAALLETVAPPQTTGAWLYGNVRLLDRAADYVPCGHDPDRFDMDLGNRLECEAEKVVLAGNVLVTGIHNSLYHRIAIVPLRWGAPRILVLNGGIRHYLGADFRQEPFRAARLWRYEFDPTADLVIHFGASLDARPRRREERNPAVEGVIARVAHASRAGWLLAEWERLKRTNPETVVFFRVGDFYETYRSDARLLEQRLDLAATARKIRGERELVAGVPFHKVERFLVDLHGLGIKSALVEEPRAVL